MPEVYVHAIEGRTFSSSFDKAIRSGSWNDSALERKTASRGFRIDGLPRFLKGTPIELRHSPPVGKSSAFHKCDREMLWGGRRGNGNFVAAPNRWSAAMPQPNDLSSPSSP